MPNVFLRILTAVVAIPGVLFITYLGGWPFAVLVTIAAVIAQHEFYAIARAGDAEPFVAPGLVVGAAVVLIPMTDYALIVAGFVIAGLVLALPFVHDRRDIVADLSTTLSGVIYPALLLGSAIALRRAEGAEALPSDSFWYVAAIFIMVWASDTLAYVAGRTFGRHPLAPTVSPNKTWEGTVGGAAGAFLAGYILKLTVLDMLSPVDIVVLAIICGGLGQIGDLAESRLKRAAGVKDSGTILPGHGGMLDRLDSIIVAMPVAFLYLLLMGHISL